MMSTVAFDTLLFAKELESAGFNSCQAEALSGAMRKAQESRQEELATKNDLFSLKIELKDEYTKLDRRIDGLESELKLMKWMLGLTLAGVAGILTILAKAMVSLAH